MEQDTQIIQKFKIAIAIGIFGLLLAAFLIFKIVPIVQAVLDLNNEYKTQVETLADKERTLADLQASAEKSSSGDETFEKAFFKPIESGLDTESIMTTEFVEIMNLIKANSVKMRSIDFAYDPADDNFIKGAPGKFNASKINARMIADYKDFEAFLKDLYKHEHFLNISQIEIIPYQKNKRILLINFEMKLYAQK